MTQKPPLGVNPHWFFLRSRIKELNDAIDRFLNHIEKTEHIESQVEHYELIAKYAEEIKQLALTEAKLQAMDKKRE